MLTTTKICGSGCVRGAARVKTFLQNSCFVLFYFVYLKRRGGEKREREKIYYILLINNIIYNINKY